MSDDAMGLPKDATGSPIDWFGTAGGEAVDEEPGMGHDDAGQAEAGATASSWFADRGIVMHALFTTGSLPIQGDTPRTDNPEGLGIFWGLAAEIGLPTTLTGREGYSWIEEDPKVGLQVAHDAKALGLELGLEDGIPLMGRVRELAEAQDRAQAKAPKRTGGKKAKAADRAPTGTEGEALENTSESTTEAPDNTPENTPLVAPGMAATDDEATVKDAGLDEGIDPAGDDEQG